MKRWLYLCHRWLGIVLGLFMAAWFLSGMVMLYVGYPKLTDQERRARLPVLGADIAVDLALALRSAGQPSAPDRVLLLGIADQPHYVLVFGKRRLAVNAMTGGVREGGGREGALAAAAAFMANGAPESPEYRGVVDEDPWTHSRALDAHRPLHVVDMRDERATWLYVSGATGEIVRDAPAVERYWNWLGAWLHWLYMFRGGAFDAQAADIVIYSSLLGSVLTVLGLWVGTLRWRFGGRYKTGARTPYRERWLRWHHVSGLVFGVFCLTWVVSGLFSMNPWKLFDSGNRLDHGRYAGGAINGAAFVLPVGEVIAHWRRHGFAAVELQWTMLNGNGHYIGFDALGRSRIVAAGTPCCDSVERFAWADLQRAAHRLLAPAKPLRQAVIERYDVYHYPRAAHTMTGHVEKRLPVMRIEFDDAADTWLHIDPYTGEYHAFDRAKRAYRWLFAFLHSWDWWPFLELRPLWDVWMVGLSLGGLALSSFGIVIGWRRLMMKTRLPGRRPTPPPR